VREPRLGLNFNVIPAWRKSLHRPGPMELETDAQIVFEERRASVLHPIPRCVFRGPSRIFCSSYSALVASGCARLRRARETRPSTIVASVGNRHRLRAVLDAAWEWALQRDTAPWLSPMARAPTSNPDTAAPPLPHGSSGDH
jgi:hypothetical protein